MSVIVASMKWQVAFFYLENICAFSKTVEQRLSQVRGVLTLLRDAYLTRRIKKCLFFIRNINYLGLVIHPAKPETAG